MRVAEQVLLLALMGCSVSCTQEPRQTSFRLMNGVELPLHELAHLQDRCELMGQRLSPDFNGICLEFPVSALNETFEPMNWYGGQLTGAGFEWASGAANQYWFNWPLENGCFRRLITTALPKAKIEGDDLSAMKDYVILFEFEADERCPSSEN